MAATYQARASRLQSLRPERRDKDLETLGGSDMNVHRKLKINWWLWMLLSIPPIVYSWVLPHDVKGRVISDWGYLMEYLQQTGYTVTHGIWNFFAETLFWSVVPALLFGWIAQYLIVLAWEALRARRRTHEYQTPRL